MVVDKSLSRMRLFMKNVTLFFILGAGLVFAQAPQERGESVSEGAGETPESFLFLQETDNYLAISYEGAEQLVRSLAQQRPQQALTLLLLVMEPGQIDFGSFLLPLPGEGRELSLPRDLSTEEVENWIDVAFKEDGSYAGPDPLLKKSAEMDRQMRSVETDVNYTLASHDASGTLGEGTIELVTYTGARCTESNHDHLSGRSKDYGTTLVEFSEIGSQPANSEAGTPMVRFARIEKIVFLNDAR